MKRAERDTSRRIWRKKREWKRKGIEKIVKGEEEEKDGRTRGDERGETGGDEGDKRIGMGGGVDRRGEVAAEARTPSPPRDPPEGTISGGPPKGRKLDPLFSFVFFLIFRLLSYCRILLGTTSHSFFFLVLIFLFLFLL